MFPIFIFINTWRLHPIFVPKSSLDSLYSTCTTPTEMMGLFLQSLKKLPIQETILRQCKNHWIYTLVDCEVLEVRFLSHFP